MNANQPDTKELDTLDERVTQTITRDIMNIYQKTKLAMLPMKVNDSSSQEFRDWDFWGPLVFCLLLGLFLSIGRKDEHTGIIFILIFVIVWVGGLIISLNAQFLGTTLTIFQCICILGYCMFAIVISGFLNCCMMALPMWVHLIVAILGFGYSSYSSFVFVGMMVPQQKKWLVVYPIFLFYLFLAWFTLAK